MEKEPTIDMLARMIAAHDERFDAVDKRFDKLEELVAGGFQGVRQDIATLATSVKELRDVVEKHDRRGDVHEEELVDLSKRILVVERKLGLA